MTLCHLLFRLSGLALAFALMRITIIIKRARLPLALPVPHGMSKERAFTESDGASKKAAATQVEPRWGKEIKCVIHLWLRKGEKGLRTRLSECQVRFIGGIIYTPPRRFHCCIKTARARCGDRYWLAKLLVLSCVINVSAYLIA